jgi:choline dehydrogenase-like flavoprotein
LQYPNFEYIPNVYVTHFCYNANRQIESVVTQSTLDDARHEYTADKYVLAAGTLSSSKIFMNSILEATGEIPKLTGLMDNRQVLIPFINLKMIGKKYDPNSYQFHQLAIGIETEKPEEYLHGQITTLKTALLHPIIQNIPLDLHMAISLFRNLRASLGIVNLNLCDRRRDDSYVTLKVDELSDQPELVIKYSPTDDENTVIKEALKKVKKMMWKLGCIVPPGMVHMREMGASVHYSGTLPMSEKPAPFTTSINCQSHDFNNLFIVDGSTFPFLPAKNITFSLMANAIRVAETAF